MSVGGGGSADVGGAEAVDVVVVYMITIADNNDIYFMAHTGSLFFPVAL
jgi:hypothetical protein